VTKLEIWFIKNREKLGFVHGDTVHHKVSKVTKDWNNEDFKCDLCNKVYGDHYGDRSDAYCFPQREDLSDLPDYYVEDVRGLYERERRELIEEIIK
jgi:hypothetical protein